jgi:hypothetical protein
MVGMNMRDAMNECRALGVHYAIIRRTGELRFNFPGFRPVVVNSRRKDAPRILSTRINQLRKSVPYRKSGLS